MGLEKIVSFGFWDPATSTLTPVTLTMATSPTTEVTPQSWEWYTADGTPPLSAPQNLSTTPGNGQVALAWSAPASDGGSSITGYILKSTDETTLAKTTITLAASTLTTTLTGLTNGQVYDFTLAASTALTAAGPTAAASATPTSGPATAPGVPTSVTGSAGVGTASLSWSPPASDGGSAVTGYLVQLGTGQILTLSASTLSHTWTGLTAGTAVSLSVQAVNAVGASSKVTKSVTPLSATSSLAAGHHPGTVMLGIVAADDGGPRPAITEADEIICLNQAGTRVRDFWLQRNYTGSPISLSSINGLMNQGDAFGQYNTISFKYYKPGTTTEDWLNVTNGNHDADLQVLANYAKNRRTANVGVREFSAGIHHEPAGDGPLSDWADMQIYCSQFFAGYRRTSLTAPYVYDATQDVTDIMAWISFASGEWWTLLNTDYTSINAAYPNSLVATFKKNRSILAGDFYEPTAVFKTDTHYADVGWIPNRATNGKVEDRIATFVADLKGRPGGCGALATGESNSIDGRDTTDSGFNRSYQVCKTNVDVVMFHNIFVSHGGPLKWEWAAEPAIYPQISKVPLSEYPPGIEVGGTWMTEQRLISLKKQLDDSRGLDSTIASRMTQWTGWP